MALRIVPRLARLGMSAEMSGEGQKRTSAPAESGVCYVPTAATCQCRQLASFSSKWPPD